jgi:hypothetical protein
VNSSHKYQWLCAVLVFSMVYLVVGLAFPNPSTPNKTQFVWRLAPWLTCLAAFAIHIGLECFRFRSSLFRTAVHSAASVALGAFALAGAANLHALSAGTGNQRLLALALVIWPLITGLPAFVVAFVLAAAFGRVRLR